MSDPVDMCMFLLDVQSTRLQTFVLILKGLCECGCVCMRVNSYVCLYRRVLWFVGDSVFLHD